MERASESWSGPAFEHAGFLARLARGLTEDEHAAADLVQETWLRALERPPRSTGSLRAWLATTARNLAKNLRRGEARRREREHESARPEALEPEHLALARLESQREVFDLVLALPETSRTLLFLRYYEDLGAAAIATRLGIAEKTAKNRLTRALAELRAELDRRHGGKREAWVLLLAPLGRPALQPSPSVPVPAGPVEAGLLGGVLAMKKALVTLVVLGGILAVWRATRPHEERVAREPMAEMASETPATPAVGAEASEVEAPLGEPAPRRSVESTTVPPGALRIRLRWSDGSPAVDVGIDARPRGEHFPRMELWREWTDGKGVARFEDLPLGTVELSIDRDFHFEGIEVTPEEREVVLDLAEGERLEGRVLDSGGRAVAGAEIWTFERGGWPTQRPIARAASDGTFVLRGVGEECLIGARARGYQPSAFFAPKDLLVGASGARTATLELGSPGAHIEGRTLDPDGHPLGGVLVMAGGHGGGIVDLPSGQRGTAATNVCVASQADGSFVFPCDFAPGRVPISAVVRGLPILSTSVEVQEGVAAYVEVRLARPATVVGRVVARDASPVEGARIRTGEDDGRWFRDSFPASCAKSGADGTFRLECVASGSQAVHAEAPSARLGRANVRVACMEGEETYIDLVLDTGDVIRGRVVDARGAPLAGWIVDDSPEPYGSNLPRRDTTDADGSFLLANVAMGAHELRVRNPDTGNECARVHARAGEEQEIVVEDSGPATAFVEGSVIGSGGEIPADVSVVVRREGEREAFFLAFDATSGQFEGGPVLPGRYGVEVLRGWKTVAESELRDIAANARVDFGIVRIEELGSVELEIRGYEPEAASNLRPRLNRPNHATETFALQEDRLLCTNLVAGMWMLDVADGEIYARSSVEVLPGETVRVELVPEPTALVSVTCRLPAGKSWRRIAFEIREDGGVELPGRILQAGKVQVTPGLRVHVPRGRWTFSARAEADDSASRTIDVDPDARSREDIELELD